MNNNYNNNNGYNDNYSQNYSEYEMYAAQFDNQNNRYVPTQAVAKKSGKGKKIALIACAMALTLCIGLGGGMLGASMTNGSSSVSTSATGTGTAKVTNSNGTDSDITIKKADGSKKTASTVEEVVAQVKDSVVEITTEQTSYNTYYGQYVSKGAGSGVIISEDGYIITNHHVIEDATTVTVKTTDNKSYTATVVGSDSDYDVALLKIDATGLTAATFGDSDKLNVGETSIVIGNPLGTLGGSVTTGVVSALNRNITIDGKTMELLQTDAAINPGNSGGGMFDIEGNLIGMVVAKSTSSSSGVTAEGLGFVIPINNIQSILGDLKTNGKVMNKALLNISTVDVDSDTKMSRYNVSEQGVYVANVVSGGAADKAGIMVGDRITKIDGTKVTSGTEVRNIIKKHKAGDKITVVVSRDGQEKSFSVTLDSSSSTSESSTSNNFRADGGNNNGSNGGSGSYNIPGIYGYGE